MARLLEPSDFGLMAMAMVFIGMVDVFYRLGTGTVIVQQKILTNELVNSLFYLNLGASILIGSVIFLLSPIIGKFYNNHEVVSILRVLSVSIVISGAGIIHHGMLRRELLFNKIAFVNIISSVIRGVIAILMAFWGFKVWALVFANLVFGLSKTILLFLSTSWKPRIRFSMTELNQVKAFIFNLTGFGIFDSIAKNADKFIIGRFLGSQLLGYYSLAFKLYTLPTQYVSYVLNKILLPSLSRAQDDHEKSRKIYLRACAGIIFITCPVGIGLFALANPFVLTIYGQKWSNAIPIIMVFAIVSIIHSITGTIGNIILAKGKSRLWFRWGVFSGIILIISYLAGLPWNLIGVSISFAITLFILTIIGFRISFPLIDLKIKNLIPYIAPYIITSLIMGAVIMAVNAILLNNGVQPALRLGVGVVLGIIIYFIIMLIFRPIAFNDFIKLLPVNHLRKWNIFNIKKRIYGVH